MNIHMNLGINSYDIKIERGIIKCASRELNLNRKVFIITDDGVPEEYSQCIASQCRESFIETVAQGEDSKSIAVFEQLLKKMLNAGFTRSDCVVAVGGGVVGDLSGFVASAYMRGIDFYNIPTTVLSQIDSSIGGKVAVNLGGVKNIVGAFYQPKKVLVDPDVLKTLPQRQISNGLAEALKMATTFDEKLFRIFESSDPLDRIDDIICSSLEIKKNVVEKDEKESGLRKVLNFGHTIGHAIESDMNLSGLYHGECVALGMIPMCSDDVRKRIVPILEKLKLPTKASFSKESVMEVITHDKKVKNGYVTAIYSDKIGSFVMKDIPCSDLGDSLDIILERGETN